MSVTRAARTDLRLLHERDPAMAAAALAVLVALEQGRVTPESLRSFVKTGDLTDCGKVRFGTVQRPGSHRMVLRGRDSGWEVLEVVVVEERTDDLPYLLAGLRLARLDDDPVRRSDAQRRVQRLLGRRGLPGESR